MGSFTHSLCGVGDIAMRFLDYCKNIHRDNTSHVTMVDINPHMLEEGKKRFASSPYANSKHSIDTKGGYIIHCVYIISQPNRIHGAKCREA